MSNSTDLLESIDVNEMYYNVLKALACYAVARTAFWGYSLFQSIKQDKMDKLTFASERLGKLSPDAIACSEENELNRHIEAVDIILDDLGRKPTLHSAEEIITFEASLLAIKTPDLESNDLGKRAEQLRDLIRKLKTECDELKDNVSIFDPLKITTSKQILAANQANNHHKSLQHKKHNPHRSPAKVLPFRGETLPTRPAGPKTKPSRHQTGDQGGSSSSSIEDSAASSQDSGSPSDSGSDARSTPTIPFNTGSPFHTPTASPHTTPVISRKSKKSFQLTPIQTTPERNAARNAARNADNVLTRSSTTYQPLTPDSAPSSRAASPTARRLAFN